MTHKFFSARLSICAALVLGFAGLPLQVMAQAAYGETVSWTVSPVDDAKPGARLALSVHGDIQRGWHVYGLKQEPLGPTPLRIGLDANPVAAAAGAPAGSAPVKIHDPAFDLETQFYDAPFTLTVPVRLDAHAAPGPRQVPLQLTFQTCNGKVCQPPKTVHLSANVLVQTGR